MLRIPLPRAFRHSSTLPGAFLIGWTLTFAAAAGPGLGAAGPELPPDEVSDDGLPEVPPPTDAYLTVGPIPGFTTGAHRVADPVLIPVSTRVRFLVNGIVAGHSVEWEGMTPVSAAGAEATFEMHRPGDFEVAALVNPGKVRLACRVHVEALKPRSLQFDHQVVALPAFEVTEDSGNEATVAAYFGLESVAALTEPGPGQLVTSIGRPLRLTARPRPRRPVEGLASLIEWRLDGKPLGVGDVWLQARARPGRHTMEVGPPAVAKRFDLTVYSVSIRGDYPDGRVPQGRPVTLRATTDPPGFESFVTWLAATKYGSAEPTLGRGPVFTTTFESTFGESGGGLFQWLGVRADNTRINQDLKVEEPGTPQINRPGLASYELPCSVDAGAPLPSGMRFLPPSAEATYLVATLPALEQAVVDPAQVFSTVIAPFVAHLGTCFDRGTAFLSTPAQVILMPAPDAAGIARAVDFDFSTARLPYGPNAGRIVDALNGRISPDTEIDRAYEEGMGMTLTQALTDLGRRRYVIPYQQIHQAAPSPASPGPLVVPLPPQVPIEHTLLLASGWEGQSVTMVQGALLDTYQIANTVVIDQAAAGAAAIAALQAVPGIDAVLSVGPEDGTELVLLPYASVGGIPQLRYTWRMILNARTTSQDHSEEVVQPWLEGPYLLWMDAASGAILQLDPLFGDVEARGRIFKRDPGAGTMIVTFQVDPAAELVPGEGNRYVLKLTDATEPTSVMTRVDYLGDRIFNEMDVSISDSDNGSSNLLANFDQFPVHDETEALCLADTNKKFEQVNFFASISRYRQMVRDLGIFEPFPPLFPWSPKVGIPVLCNASSSMLFGVCDGYKNAACPSFSTGTVAGLNFMNFAHDNTVVAHELGHNIMPRLTCGRPPGWCCGAGAGFCTPACARPQCWVRFHDIADFWADHFEHTNCTGGWVAKNSGGVDARRYCAASDEKGGLPRQHMVTAQFDPGLPLDHFPERRDSTIQLCGVTQGYADMHTPAAALWQVRAGMESKFRPTGVAHFGVRYQNAVKEAGFLGFFPACSDRDIYHSLYNLEVQMVEQWATSGSLTGGQAFKHNGPHTTSKVLAGFAKAGLFLVPPACLDGGILCPQGENGGDAVVDVDDNDAAPDDDVTVDSVLHPEVDYVDPATRPTFHVWTGPRYRLDGTAGAHTLADPAPCNPKFQVEVSTESTFPAGAGTILSGWTVIDTNPTPPPGGAECYGTWTPSVAEWGALTGGGGDNKKLYYRARTRDAADGNERLSTLQGNGLWPVPPPFLVVKNGGSSDY